MKTIPLFLALMFTMTAYSQINISLLHQLVEDSKTEYGKQVQAKEVQSRNAFHEEVNRTKLTEVIDRYKTIQERFAKLSVLFEAAGLAQIAHPMVLSILNNQNRILTLCQKNPALVPFALETEKIFAKQSYALMNYLIGLGATLGDLNQMKISERRMLFQHVLHELGAVNHLSLMTSKSLESRTGNIAVGNPYPDNPINDQRMLKEVLRNIQIQKP